MYSDMYNSRHKNRWKNNSHLSRLMLPCLNMIIYIFVAETALYLVKTF
jgi:hypothetical protein